MRHVAVAAVGPLTMRLSARTIEAECVVTEGNPPRGGYQRLARRFRSATAYSYRFLAFQGSAQSFSCWRSIIHKYTARGSSGG